VPSPRHPPFTPASTPRRPSVAASSSDPATIERMSITQIITDGVRAGRGRAFTGRSLVGDIESEYDEYDRDADLETSKRRDGWLEPSW
jgi:hypothetical protein